MTSALRASLAALLLAAITLVLLWPREPAMPQEPSNGRLPTVAIPDHYLLRLSIFPDQPSFRGEVEITLHLQASVRSLYLHGRDLTVHLVEARRAGEEAISGRYQQLTPQGLARIDFDEKVPAGFLTLVLHYDGRYTNTSEGLSRVQVGKDWYVFSQFHPIEARRVFPGFDEPSFKASFELEILSWQQDAVIGNSLPNETRQLADNLKWTRLSPTPRLPSFLLNLSVGPFDVVNGPVVPANEVRAQPLSLRAVTTRGQGVHTRFALDHTAAMLSRFEQYFAVPFPFDKLDLIAVPDTSSNVLENPGAINFRDQLMLIDEHASIEDQQSFLAHHAHALAHQWFGDLVTMPWWDDLWLNEGFAEWLGYEVAIKSHPEFPLALAMQQQLEHAMQRDGLSPQVRIRQPLSREQDVQSTFNTVVYDKAMGLMRMYQRYLGDEQFRQGLRNYFARHAFGNATANDLFLSLGDSVADPAVTRSFDSFLDQPGLPQIELTQHCDNGKLQLNLRQQAYQPAGNDRLNSIWQLPVCLRTPGDTPPACRLLTEPEVRWTPGWRCGELVLPNAAGAGYYRWQVNAEHRQALLAQLPQLPLTEVLDIVANLDAALRAGALSIEAYWQSLPALATHAEPTVLKATLDSWRYVLQTAPEPVRQHWRQQLLRYFRTATPHQDSTALLQFRALDLHDDALRQQLRQLHGTSIKPLLRAEPLPDLPNALALSIAFADDSSLLTQLPNYLLTESRNTVRSALLQALSWQRDPNQVGHVQQLLLSADLRIHERWQLLKASLLQPALATANWQWLRQQSDAMLALLPDFRHSQLPELAEAICDAEQWRQTEQFLRDHRDTLAITDAALASTDSHVRQCLSLRTAFAAAAIQP